MNRKAVQNLLYVASAPGAERAKMSAERESEAGTVASVVSRYAGARFELRPFSGEEWKDHADFVADWKGMLAGFGVPNQSWALGTSEALRGRAQS